ncbi:MAG: hypothetical protein ACI8T1_003501 [Verrucomicrobiales bacterium]
MSEPPSKPNPLARPLGSNDRPLVLVVLPRIVDLVIQQDRALTPAFFSQRRSSYALRRERLMEIVDLDELGLDEQVRLPPEVVLVAQSRQRRNVGPVGLAPEYRTWRLAAAALAILRLDEAHATDRLSTAMVHQRIEIIGRETFAEIESVLHRELRLFEDDDLVRIYIEFITLHSELQTFSPKALDTYFPAIRGRQVEIAEMGRDDLEWEETLVATRPEGLSLPRLMHPSDDEDAAAEDEALGLPLPPLRPNSKQFDSLMKWGAAALDRGNAVVGAILFRRASRLAPDTIQSEQSEAKSREVIDGLVSRLQQALAFDDARAETWRQALLDLFRHSSRGFWNTNKRLLYDLQKVCVDYERESYAIDIFGFLRTFGRRPIKRPLPNQREVLMSKHLRNASSRLAKARVTASQRGSLSNLLREATTSAEQQLRGRLRIRIARSLNEKGLSPENIPERVARQKLIEELLDCVVRRGHLSMGDVRDAISRSQLKLSDLTGRELLGGDAILRADRRLNRLLDGVYRRGEFYLRGLQYLSSLGFGRVSGRFIFQYLVVPFGGAFVALEAVSHLWEKVRSVDSSYLTERQVFFPNPLLEKIGLPEKWHFGLPDAAYYEFAKIIPPTIVLGFFILGLIHAQAFRALVWAVTQGVFRYLKRLLIDFPRWIMGLEWARLILRSRLAKVMRRYLVTPLIPAVILYVIATVFVDFNRFTAVTAFMLIFTALDFFLNSTFGRRFEERVGAWVARAWYRFRVQVIRSLFDAIMGLFRRLIEISERVLYAIDEWLLFKTGENRFTFWIKGILGGIWSVVAYGIRFCLTLLVEPQINPIKHFPVVTVSHKILLPSQPFLANWIGPAGIDIMGNAMAQTVAASIVFLTPGIAGFLVWELKSNWRLYQANRDTTLKPVVVGLHGESLPRLLKPGFHSGAIGKIYARMRRAEKQGDSLRRRQSLAQSQEQLHHLEVAVRQFVEREMFSLLRQAPEMKGLRPEVSDIKLLPSAIHLRLVLGGAGWWKESAPLHLLFQARRDWLVVKVVDPGWLGKLEPEQKAIVATALAGLYKLSGVELVDEQVRHTLSLPNLAYHLRLSDMEVWAGDQRGMPVNYGLRTWGMIRPHPSSLAKSLGFPSVAPKQLLFGECDLAWNSWVHYWQKEELDLEAGDILTDTPLLLPVERPVVLS